MLTSSSGPRTAPLERDDRPPYRPYRVTVRRLTQLSPHFVRVTLTGPDLHVFGTDGLDQRIKLFFPLPGVGLADFDGDPDWYAAWLALPEDRRNPMRTYTVRAVRPEQAELDVDFVVHRGAAQHGPAGRWLHDAGPGGELIVVGPDARSRHSAQGIDWHPGQATDLLLVGDETAAPAIAAILESLPTTVSVTAFVEVADAADTQQVDSGHAVDWVVRDPAARGAALRAAVAHWLGDHPALLARAAAAAPQALEDVDVDTDQLWETTTGGDGGFYAWLAGEAAVVKSLRRLLVGERGIDRSRVAFMGYWREGRAEDA